MASTDFYMHPRALSVFYTDALKREGHDDLVGWRSSPVRSSTGVSPQSVEVLTASGKVLRVGTGARGVVNVEEIPRE